MGPHPAVAAIRLAVRRVLHDVIAEHAEQTERAGHAAPHPELAQAGAGSRRGALPDRPDTPLVLVACSGGADSMALASALAFEARKLPVRAGGITVDHGLQDGSDSRAS